MEITNRSQIELHMIMYCVRVSASRETYVERLVATSLPYKKEYGDGEFFMWAFDAKGKSGDIQPMSITDMGIEQFPQYNLHLTFTTRTEAVNYEHIVGIDYDGEDKAVFEFGDDIYNIDESVSPNELIPFDFDIGEMSPELKEMCVSWSTAMSDEAEEINHDVEVHNAEPTAYDRAMKGI